MTQRWYYTCQGAQVGPVSEEELRALLTSGQIALTEQVWREGTVDRLPPARALEIHFSQVSVPDSDEPPPFPLRHAQESVVGSAADGTRHPDEPPPFPPSTAKIASCPSMSPPGPVADLFQTVTVHDGLPQHQPTDVPLTPLNIPKSVAVAMTVAVLLPFLLSTAGTLGMCSAPAFWLSFLQDGFALFACVATLRRTKLYWLSVMASVLTLIPWFWLSFTILPIGLVFVGTVASIGIGTWSFVVIRKPEVRYGFGSQFDPVDWLGKIVLRRLPKFNIAPTPGNISRASVLSLSGLCLVGVLIGGILQDRDEKRKKNEHQAETLADKAKRTQEMKEKVQTALTQFDANKDLAADTLFEAWKHDNGYYKEVVEEAVRGTTSYQQQKMFQLKTMIQPRIDKDKAETEAWLRKQSEERERREASKKEPSDDSSGGGWFGGGKKVYGTWRDLQVVVRDKSQQQVVAILGKPDSIYTSGTFADHSDDEVWTYYDMLRHPVTGQKQSADVHFARGICNGVTDR